MLRHNQSPTSPERVVVLGAAGFVGRSLVERLRTAGVPVVALTRREIDLLTDDAADRLAGLLRPGDAVVATAARAPCKTVALLADNINMTRTMIEALTKVPVGHVVNISSDAVYADLTEPLTEESSTAPNTLHGVMHLAREIAFSSELGSPLAILRPSALYGATDPHNSYGPNRFLRLAQAGEPIVLFGEGEERRDHVLIDDVAEVIFRVLHRRSTGILNIATGEVHSFRRVAELAVAQTSPKVKIDGSPRVGPMPHNGYRPFDIAGCNAAFPDFAYTPLAIGIEKTRQALEAG